MAEPIPMSSTRSTAVPPLRRTPISEWQRALDEHDERLAPELKQHHPILPMEVIKQQYPDRWLALLITHVDERGDLAAARVFDSAGHDEREALEERVKPLSRVLPERRFFFFYTGIYDDFGSAW